MSELTTLVKGIRDWQLARNISDSELCRKFAGLGSTKTFKRILDGDLAELDLERWEAEYAQVWTLMELEGQSGADDEPVFDDLWHITATRLAVADAMRETGNNRLVIVEGPSGSGKTTAGRALARRYGRKVVFSEADETWKGPQLGPMMGGLLRALGVREIPTSGEERKTKLMRTLCQAPVCLIIDEAHHLGPRTLNLIKSMLNQTPCQIVLLCIPTLFRKLEMSAYEEALQLTKNRLCERVKLNGPRADDVEKMFSRRLEWEPDTLKACAKRAAAEACAHGSWNFINLVARRCRQLAGKDKVDQEVFAKALAKVQASR